MANPASQLTTGSTIAWSSGASFNGYALLVAALPALGSGSYPQASAASVWPKHRIPTHVQVPIEAGVYDADAKVMKTSAIEPPGVKYTAYFFDINDVLVATGDELFVVTADTHTLNPPTLTAPTAASVSVAPESGTTGQVQNFITTAPTLVDLTGTKDGVNKAFTVPGGTINAMQLFWNGQYLEDGVGYTRAGNSVTLTDAPGAGDSLEATVWYV